ncbi:MAG: pantetheine-phosphate adenylyltransferase, partial [archaeon]|nr:pantetheine-phosphate adenylyltransferase [archaeon]
TFDHLHNGHKLLIETAFKLGKKVVIGLATDNLLKEKEYKNEMQTYEVRKQKIISFVEDLNPDFSDSCEIIPLNDPFGPAITEEIDIHVSSEETIQVAIKINKIREQKGLKKMILVAIPIIYDKKGEKISSTSIRKHISS